jgi:hypothetical protein
MSSISKKRNVVAIAICLAGITIFSGCTKNDPKVYTITFDSQGGTSVQTQSVTAGSTVTEPTEPTMTNYAFFDWYKEPSCINAWNFSTDKVESNTTLYAKWGKPIVFRNGGSTPADADKGFFAADVKSFNFSFVDKGSAYTVDSGGNHPAVAGIYYYFTIYVDTATMVNYTNVSPMEGVFAYKAFDNYNAHIGTFYGSIQHFNAGGYDVGSYIDFASGTVKIKKYGNSYKLTFSGKDANGQEYNIVYDGPIVTPVYDTSG